MSYCRLMKGDSDIYLYFGGGDDTWVCCFCLLGASADRAYDRWYGRTISEVRAHLLQHRAAGHLVPDFVLRMVEAEIEHYGPDWDGKEEDDNWQAPR